MSLIKDALSNVKVVLASSSPQRKAILEQIGLTFQVIPSPFDEETVSRDSFKQPLEYVRCVARQKALAVAEQFRGEVNKTLVIGADTVIVHQNKILGKPHTPDVAIAMLQRLSNNTHTVYTGVSLIKVDADHFTESLFDEETEVQFGKLTDDEIKTYVATGEPLNKAGSYGIQGVGAVLVERINGDYNNVVGFPAYKFCRKASELIRGDECCNY